MKREFYDIVFRKKIITSLEDLQAELDLWLNDYNNLRPHSGRYCYGKTPMQTFRDSKHIAIDKNIDNMSRISDSLTNLAQTVWFQDCQIKSKFLQIIIAHQATSV